jgi:hypothetical protein
MTNRMNFTLDNDSGEPQIRQFPWLTLFLVLDVIAVLAVLWYFHSQY